MAITTIKTEYVPNGAENKFLKLEVIFTLGGRRNGKVYPRGYYATVIPVEREVFPDHTSETHVAFSGRKIFLVAAHRRGGSKIEAEALKLFTEMRTDLLTAFEGQL
jgi:hypothetical protein